MAFAPYTEPGGGGIPIEFGIFSISVRGETSNKPPIIDASFAKIAVALTAPGV